MIGHKIRALREEKGISPKDFANRLDMDVSTLNRIGNCKINSFKPNLLIKIAENLNVGVGELLGQNSPVALQHNEQGDNINILHQQNRNDRMQELQQELFKAKDMLIESLQRQIEILNEKLKN
ncbi:helix-turn-helix transcriptional regulator [Runella sp.]|uniref:helix-turn-helix domain-containing protein n=1 Tax=Runella sp. TaxID=1960881 RepID=UPI0026153DD9|nr:helix-turn-helix transcriptional regulator [Runella sp.]